ncbi:MAG: DUF7683 domain-containing protein [Mycobacteriales bacterium]
MRGYERTDDELITEIEVNDLISEWFRSELGVASTDSMVSCFPLPTDILTKFLELLGATVNNKGEDFFLECEAEPRE